MLANFNFARRKMAYARDLSADDVMRLTQPGQMSYATGQQLLDGAMPGQGQGWGRGGGWP